MLTNDFLKVFILNYIHAHVSICKYMYMDAEALGGQKGVLVYLEMELQEAVNYLFLT